MKKLIVLCSLVVTCSLSASAQNRTVVLGSNIQLGDIRALQPGSNATYPVVTIAEVLANPRLVASSKEIQIERFKVRVLPKNGSIQGPIYVTGDRLNDESVALLTKHAGGGGMLFIEDIYYRNGNQDPVRKSDKIIINYSK